jgi:hypothetical protein
MKRRNKPAIRRGRLFERPSRAPPSCRRDFVAGVLDGHGAHGGQVSQWVAEKLCARLLLKAEKITVERAEVWAVAGRKRCPSHSICFPGNPRQRLRHRQHETPPGRHSPRGGVSAADHPLQWPLLCISYCRRAAPRPSPASSGATTCSWQTWGTRAAF